jgi:hypothetical protein
MPVQIDYEPKHLIVARFQGVLKRSEFGGTQNAAAKEIDAGFQPRVLAILDGFQGWERGADWNDLDFMLTHGNEIAKIAIVGDPRWETEALAFAGAGFRRAPVKFFPADGETQARAWLSE